MLAPYEHPYSLGGKTYDGSYSSLMGVSESGAAGSAYHKDIFNSWNGARQV